MYDQGHQCVSLKNKMRVYWVKAWIRRKMVDLIETLGNVRTIGECNSSAGHMCKQEL